MSSLTYCMQPSSVWSTSPSSYAHHCVSLHVKENDRLTPLVFVAYGIIFHTKWIGEFFVLSNQFHIKFQIDSNSHEKKHLEHLLPVSTIASWHLYHICTELIKASQNDDLLHALERNIYCISLFSFQSYIHTSLACSLLPDQHSILKGIVCPICVFVCFEYTICPSLELCDPCRCLFELSQILRYEYHQITWGRFIKEILILDMEEVGFLVESNEMYVSKPLMERLILLTKINFRV